MAKGKIVLILLVLIVIFAVGWSTVGCAPLSQCPWEKGDTEEAPKKVALTFVGAMDSAGYWKEIIAAFNKYEAKKRNLNVSVRYEQLDKYTYEDVLLDKMLNQESPNIFLAFNTWIPKYRNRIIAAPESMMSINEFEDTFAPVASEDLIIEGEIYSLPLYIDTLALYYNKDMFLNAGYITAPKTWQEFTDYVEKLTIMNEKGGIDRLGATIGGGEMVNRSSDVIMLMVMQNNSQLYPDNLASFSTVEAMTAIKFYTDFANSDNRFYTWDPEDQQYSIDYFTQGKAAMSINYSYEIENIENKTGGNLNYGIAAVPQQYMKDRLNYASYWTPVVAKGASCTKEDGVSVSCESLAWEFIYFAAQAENAGLYLEQANRPAANLTLAKQQSSDSGSQMAPFASQVFTAKSWEDTENKKNDEVLMKMIDSIISTDNEDKKDLVIAISDAKNQIKELN
ncbi:MAG: extracellular solute-binding protein [Candidatus Pacebacteria bacterium]|nr:extracellular solute-binding protein [Candidatus Paceibacterota bacterium]